MFILLIGGEEIQIWEDVRTTIKIRLLERDMSEGHTGRHKRCRSRILPEEHTA
jgi:hypothetical protein